MLGVDPLLAIGLHHGVGTCGRVELNGGAEGRLLLAESGRCSCERQCGLTSKLKDAGRSKDAGTGLLAGCRLAGGRLAGGRLARRQRWYAEGLVLCRNSETKTKNDKIIKIIFLSLFLR